MPPKTIPTEPPFDVYRAGGTRPIAELLSYPEVQAIEDGAQITIDSTTHELVLQSGGTGSVFPPQLYIHAAVPATFTFECVLRLTALPPNFSSVARSHVFIGISDPKGPTVGLFISRIGVAYAGSCRVAPSGDLLVDGPLEPLADASVPYQEGDVVTVRIAADSTTGTAYVYLTKTAELGTRGHQLRAMMPLLLGTHMATPPPIQTMVSVRGTAALAVTLGLGAVGLGRGLFTQNMPPHADAGPDQAIRAGTVAELDATRSFDPEGAPLVYRWRLIDAPLGSPYEFEGTDGATRPLTVPTGFTDRFYAQSLGIAHARDPFTPGDVLVVAGVVRSIRSVESDTGGTFVRIEGFELRDTIGPSATFKILRQRGVKDASAAKPTFLAAVPGLYKFDLRVFDGNASSEPAVTVLNVTESALAYGYVPDLRFMWDALSDFWRLVEGVERIESFWGGLAQIASAELLHLWQAEYGKSLRDIQRTTQRRWLHYDLEMREPFPELTSSRVLWGGLESSDGGALGVDLEPGAHVDLLFGEHTEPLVIRLQGASPRQTLQNVATQLSASLAQMDPRISVRLLSRRTDGVQRIRIHAPYPITVAPSTTARALFTPGATNGMPRGSGTAASSQTYRADRSLEHLGIGEGDLLVLGEVAYRIARIVDDPTDPWPFQRVTLLDTIPIPAPMTWCLPGQVSSPSLDFWRGLVGAGDVASLEVVASDQSSCTFAVDALGACSTAPTRLALDLTKVGIFLAQAPAFATFFRGVLRRSRIPRHPLVDDIPRLQERVVPTGEAEILHRNVDYFLEEARDVPCIRFVTGPMDDVWQQEPPPPRLWAEATYLDNRPTIEANFGIPAGLRIEDVEKLPLHVDYLSAVRGLWFAYANGPTIRNLRVGAQILLGLPFAEAPGTIEDIRRDFSATEGRILVRDVGENAIVRSYSFPLPLDMAQNPVTRRPYVVGDAVALFAPLTNGVEIVDYVSHPTWFRGYIQQGSMVEVEKYWKFQVRVDASAFHLAALLFVQAFILRVKPTSTLPLFVVLRTLDRSDIDIIDVVTAKGRLVLDAGICSLTAWGDTMFDQPRSAGGGWKSQYDQRPLALGPPSAFPEPSHPIAWGFDKAGTLCPDYDVLGTGRIVYATPSVPTYDSIFAFDAPVYSTSEQPVSWSYDTKLPAGTYVIHRNM